MLSCDSVENEQGNARTFERERRINGWTDIENDEKVRVGHGGIRSPVSRFSMGTA